MSKIILSIGTLCAGGAERVVSNLSKPLADTFDEVIIVMWVKAPIFYQTDSRVRLECVESGAGSKNDFKRMKWFRSFIRKEKPNIVVSFLEPLNLRVLVSLIGLNVRTIVAERNDPHVINGNWLMDQIEKNIYRLSDGILVQTDTIKKFFDGSLEKKTTVIYNPVNIEERLIGTARSTSKKNRIVSVARLMPQKNQKMLIRAFFDFYQKHKDYELTIYGEGPERVNLEEFCKQLGVGDAVKLPGQVSNVWNNILDAKCFVLTSKCEGMPNALIESMCLGVPCISTKVSGAVDLIEDGTNGILVEQDDWEATSKAMSKIVDDSQLSDRLAYNACQLFRILKSDVITKQWIDYINSKL